ncbi:MAG: right-handed parallel beta-helix repeat-containing protein, partial [Prevotellaceae bacterium]|nr:right-handed parallel beta-helix repeat-containing protein [Prevotellaceae bacterium]
MVAPRKYLCQILLLLNAGAACAADVWVSPQGNDTCSGSQNAPVATLRMALQKVREARRLHPDTPPAGGFHIAMRGGSYFLDEPIFIRPEDAGTENSPTIIEAARGEKPVVSGGVVVGSWSKAGSVRNLPKAAQGKVWVADAPTFGGRHFDFRQLWVNGKKATRARSVNQLDQMPHILGANKRAEELYIRTPQQCNLSNPAPMEMQLHQMWEIAVLRVKSMTVRGDTTTVKFFQPESRIEFQHPWPPLVLQHDSLGGNSTYFLSNAIEFLDSPSEWFYDAHNGKLYYYPRSDEDMRSATVVAPYFETIVRIEGTPDRQPHHVELRGIGFAHSTWLRPSLQGHVPLQAGMYLVDAYKLRPAGTHERPKLENQAWTEPMPGGLSLKYAHHIRFFR